MRKVLLVIFILAIPAFMLFGFERFLDHKAPEILPEPTAAAPIEIPARPGSQFPNLATSPAGEVFLSWLEPAEEGRHQLRFSRLLRNRWTQPVTIAEGARWFVNWADFPSIEAAADGRMAAHWLAYRDEGKYDYDVHISLSTDSGKTWSESITPHRDGVAAEHGFVSLLWWRDRFSVFWLDGRYTVETPRRPMTLRYAAVDDSGRLFDEVELDGSVCDCCQTSAALTSEGPIVAYRDRSEEEIRDIRVIRFEENGWSTPLVVAQDHWKIEGCPVNGPAIAARGSQVAVAWFTQGGDIPQVRLAFSEDGGRSFPRVFRVDSGDPFGRVDLLLNTDGSAWVSWLEANSKDEAEIRLQRFTSNGPAGNFIVVGLSSASRASGFPRMTHSGNDLIVAWTEPGSPGHIRSAWIR